MATRRYPLRRRGDPNQHKLALQFGVLDNFYDSGEVSGRRPHLVHGLHHQRLHEKNWPIGYFRSKERTYDADEPWLTSCRSTGVPDIDDPATGFIWDNLASAAWSYRIYGEFIQAVWCKNQKAKSPKKEHRPQPLRLARVRDQEGRALHRM